MCAAFSGVFLFLNVKSAPEIRNIGLADFGAHHSMEVGPLDDREGSLRGPRCVSSRGLLLLR